MSAADKPSLKSGKKAASDGGLPGNPERTDLWKIASGYNIDGEAREILDARALAFIQKPFNRAELSLKVAESLGKAG